MVPVRAGQEVIITGHYYGNLPSGANGKDPWRDQRKDVIGVDDVWLEGVKRLTEVSYRLRRIEGIRRSPQPAPEVLWQILTVPRELFHFEAVLAHQSHSCRGRVQRAVPTPVIVINVKNLHERRRGIGADTPFSISLQ